MHSEMASYDIATRALVVTLKALGKSDHEVTYLTGVPKQMITTLFARAIRRGFDYNERPMKLLDGHLEDRPQSVRPPKQEEASERAVDAVSYAP
jgi:hypothetical protein